MHDTVQPRALEILEDSKRWTGGKQRLTAARLYTMLVGEGCDVGYTVVKQIVREWKRRKQEVFVPLVYHYCVTLEDDGCLCDGARGKPGNEGARSRWPARSRGAWLRSCRRSDAQAESDCEWSSTGRLAEGGKCRTRSAMTNA